MPQRLFRLLPLAALLGSACGDAGGGVTNCAPDQDNVVGGNVTVLLSVSDTGFAVGGVNSGSTQRNIAVQNSSIVTLVVTNVGSRPHGFRVACISADLPTGCPPLSCFPNEASIAGLAPGESATTTFQAPLIEGAYPFGSDQPGDAELVGQFVVM